MGRGQDLVDGLGSGEPELIIVQVMANREDGFFLGGLNAGTYLGLDRPNTALFILVTASLSHF